MNHTLVVSIAVAAVAFMSSRTARAQDDSAPFANPPPASSAPMARGAGSFGSAGQWVASMRTAPGSGFLYFHNPGGDGWEIAIHPPSTTSSPTASRSAACSATPTRPR